MRSVNKFAQSTILFTRRDDFTSEPKRPAPVNFEHRSSPSWARFAHLLLFHRGGTGRGYSGSGIGPDLWAPDHFWSFAGTGSLVTLPTMDTVAGDPSVEVVAKSVESGLMRLTVTSKDSLKPEAVEPLLSWLREGLHAHDA